MKVIKYLHLSLFLLVFAYGIAVAQGPALPVLSAEEWDKRGLEASKAGDINTAIFDYEQAVRKDPSSPLYAMDYGLSLRFAGRYSDAEAAVSLSLMRFTQPFDQDVFKKELKNNYFAWGRSAVKSGDLTKAFECFHHALLLSRETKNGPDIAVALNALGNVSSDLFQHARAIEYHRQALKAMRATGNTREIAKVIMNLGSDYTDAGLYYPALASYREALTIYRSLGDKAREGESLNSIGIVYSNLNQVESAIGYFDQALRIAREAGGREAESNALANLGVAHNHAHHHPKAIECFEQVLVLARQAGNRRQEEGALNSEGNVYSAMSNYGKAMECFQRALAISRDLKDIRGQGDALIDIGNTYVDLNQTTAAIASFEQALIFEHQVGNRKSEGIALNNLGNASSGLNLNTKASAYYTRALAVAREMGDRQAEARTLNNTGTLEFRLGRKKEALATFTSAMIMAREARDSEDQLLALENLGELTGRAKRYDEAIRYFNQALIIEHDVDNRSGEADTFADLAGIYAQRGQIGTAIFYGKQSIDAFQDIRRNMRTLDRGLQDSYLASHQVVYRKVAELLIRQGRLSEAQRVLELLKNKEYFDFLQRDAKEAPGLLGEIAFNAAETVWQHRSVAISGRITTIIQRREALLAKQVRAFQGGPPFTTTDRKKLAAADHELAATTNEFQAFLSHLATEFEKSARTGRKLDNAIETDALTTTLGKLGAGTVALYTIIEPTKYRVIVVAPQLRKAEEYPINSDDLNRKILAFRESLQDPGVDPRPLAHELYNILIGPIEKDLAAVHATTLMWSLDGTLRYLPFAALYDGKQYLVERYRSEVFTLASRSQFDSASRAVWTALGLGVSKAQEGFEALPAVPAELHGIIRDTLPDSAGILPGMVMLDGQFTKAAMVTALKQQGYPVVHIASHFSFHPGDDTDSFLLLGDGTHLSMAELRALPHVFQGVDLLTLSACDTAMGNEGADGKEVEGCAVLAQRQGARAVVASLWPIADESTQQLMRAFYRYRQEHPPSSKAEALQAAQLSLLRGNGNGAAIQTRGRIKPRGGDGANMPDFTADPKTPFAHPYFWAPFIMMGDWR